MSFALSTYNLSGFNLDRSMLANLFVTADIICVQEHWLSPHRLNILKTAKIDFHVCALSSMENGFRNEIIFRRSYDGTAIIFRRSMLCNVPTYSMYICDRCVHIAFAYKVEHWLYSINIYHFCQQMMIVVHLWSLNE